MTIYRLAFMVFWIGLGVWGGVHAKETPVLSQKVYATTSQALHNVFPNATLIVSENIKLSSQDNDVRLFHGYNKNESLGMAVILNEQGKYYPITMMIHVTAQQTLGNIVVMIYRERIGRAIRKKRFLKQFRGKTKESPLRVSKDIDGITGATISSWSVARASKKALLLAHVYQKKENQ